MISVYDVINKNLSLESNYTVDEVMWPNMVTLALLWKKLSMIWPEKPLFLGAFLIQVQ